MRQAHPTAPGVHLAEILCAKSSKAAARFIFVLCCVLALPLRGHGQQNAQAKDLASASLEDLMNIQVTSVSKTEQSLSQTAAAVFVITQEDILRSGATDVPELLRMVPGVQVAQIDGNKWAISARGLNGLYTNELLVMVDGRTVYTPTFGGVFWDVLDFPLEDIEQIEVVRGPGSAVWGANAVNGVINIITKKAKDTRGGLAVARGGNSNGESGIVQYGSALGNSTDFRVFVKDLNRESLLDPFGVNASDGWHLFRGGFRLDSSISAKDNVSVEGDMYTGREGVISPFSPSIAATPQPRATEVNLSGGSIQATWNHTYSSRSDSMLEFSYDRYQRNDALGEGRQTFDLNFQHHFAAGDRNDIVWGGGYRFSTSDSPGSVLISVIPGDQNYQLFSGFVQDEIAIIPNRVHVTFGTKLEHNQFTGFVAMPSARVAWTPSSTETFWAAVSHAVRTPTMIDESSRINTGPIGAINGLPLILSVFGNPKLDNGDAMSYEFGYRSAVSKRLTLDIASYYTRYTDRETADPGSVFFEPTPGAPHFTLPLTFGSLMNGESHGIEVFAGWKATSRWTISPGYAFERVHMHADPASRDTISAGQAEGSAPVNSAQIRSHLMLPRGLSWDTSAYLVGRILVPAIDGYTRLDTGVTWQLGEHFSFTVFGQNLLQPRHGEFVDVENSVGTSLMQRGGYAKLRWAF